MAVMLRGPFLLVKTIKNKTNSSKILNIVFTIEKNMNVPIENWENNYMLFIIIYKYNLNKAWRVII